METPSVAPPKTLVGRETQVEIVYNFISEHCRNGTGGSLCISGIPGTGKTASLNVALERANEVLGPALHVAKVNAGYLRKPKQVFAEIMRSLTGKRYTVKNGTEAYKALIPGTIVVVDEVDRLMTSTNDVLYTLFDATTQNVALIAIANTLNLLDEVIPKVASRIGVQRLAFEAYKRDGLIKIIKSIIPETQLSEKARFLIASRIGASTGDIRRALELVRQSIDEARREGKTCAYPEHVARAISNNCASPLGIMVSNLSKVAQQMLKSCVLCCAKSKDGTTTFGEACALHANLCNDAKLPFSTYFQGVLANLLREMGLIDTMPLQLNGRTIIMMPANLDVDIVREVLGLGVEEDEEDEEEPDELEEDPTKI